MANRGDKRRLNGNANDDQNENERNPPAVKKFKYKCNICSYGTNEKVSFEKHQGMHGHNGKYKCKYCNAAFDSARALSPHEQLHKRALARDLGHDGAALHGQNGAIHHGQIGAVPHGLNVAVPHGQNGAIHHGQIGAVPHGLNVAVPHGLNGTIHHGQVGAVPHGLNVAVPHGLNVAVPHGLNVAVPRGQYGAISGFRTNNFVFGTDQPREDERQIVIPIHDVDYRKKKQLASQPRTLTTIPSAKIINSENSLPTNSTSTADGTAQHNTSMSAIPHFLAPQFEQPCSSSSSSSSNNRSQNFPAQNLDIIEVEVKNPGRSRELLRRKSIGELNFGAILRQRTLIFENVKTTPDGTTIDKITVFNCNECRGEYGIFPCSIRRGYCITCCGHPECN